MNNKFILIIEELVLKILNKFIVNFAILYISLLYFHNILFNILSKYINLVYFFAYFHIILFCLRLDILDTLFI